MLQGRERVRFLGFPVNNVSKYVSKSTSGHQWPNGGPTVVDRDFMEENKPRGTLTNHFYRKLPVFNIKSAGVSMENLGF